VILPPRGALLVLSGAGLFGTVGTARELGPDAGAAGVAAARLAVAALLLLFVVVVTGEHRQLRWLSREGPVWVSAVAQVGFQVTFLAAVPRVGVAVGTLVTIGCTPILTGLVAGHTDRTWLAATSLAVSGLVLLVSGGAEGQVDVLGLLCAFGASACYAVYIGAGRAMTDRRLPMTAAITTVFVLAGAMLCPALLLTDMSWQASAGGVAMTLYLAAVPTVLAYGLFNRGLREVQASHAATLGLIEPVVAATLGVVVLHEHLGVTGFAGTVLVLVGLVVLIQNTARAEQSAT
jgi:drug/metabolite transporter, DME family